MFKEVSWTWPMQLLAGSCGRSGTGPANTWTTCDEFLVFAIFATSKVPYFCHFNAFGISTLTLSGEEIGCCRSSQGFAALWGWMYSNFCCSLCILAQTGWFLALTWQDFLQAFARSHRDHSEVTLKIFEEDPANLGSALPTLGWPSRADSRALIFFSYFLCRLFFY